MRVALLTREFPPDVYGGAGVHVDYLSRELTSLVDLDVHCLGAQRPDATAHSEDDPRLAGANPALRIFAANLEMAAQVGVADLVHSHTWYANLAGQLAKLLHGIPHVITAHSLEPRRPWKSEQLGGGYRLSSWAEEAAYASADAVIAVSSAMRADVLACYPAVPPERVHVIPNGIDTLVYAPDPQTDVLERLGIDPGRPSVVFVGRITRQKGVTHLLRAATSFDPAAQLVLLAGAADTPELARESAAAVEHLRSTRDSVVWVQEMLPRGEVIQVLSHATVFCCPSIYEPQGIVNLEAMACETAVAASAVGGIPEVVVDGQTGLLVDYAENDAGGFERGLAEAVNALIADPARARALGKAGRERAVLHYGWDAIARRTVEVYSSVL
ncbi:glycogen synthase [Actinopolymorpha alba]|uniref:glycogen synthase n=1 Tax=Actinopolymorpha alba TaxID=533267 RepID=UPI000374196A|nr:glycogen synthase [Actinopolymorpha alba]